MWLAILPLGRDEAVSYWVNEQSKRRTVYITGRKECMRGSNTLVIYMAGVVFAIMEALGYPEELSIAFADERSVWLDLSRFT